MLDDMEELDLHLEVDHNMTREDLQRQALAIAA